MPRPKKADMTNRAGSIKACAAKLGVPASWVSKAKESGLSAFAANGTVDVPAVKAWIESNRKELEATADQLPLREQKLAEEIRKLRLANDARAGTLVEIAWVHERFQRLGGEIHGIRAMSEAEDPLRFAATNGDVALCRTHVRAIWDKILAQFQETAKHFER